MWPLLNFLILFSLSALAQQTLKTVELEWEEVTEAESYVVKLTPTQGGDPLYFTTKQARLTEQVPVGTYELRIRTRAKEDDVYSPWSDPLALEVIVKELKPLSPPDKAQLQAQNRDKEEVEFSWTPIDKVKDYHIKIWTENAADKPLEFTTKATKKSLSVKTGRQYFWQVSFESATDISYAQTPPTFSFTLVGSKLMPPTKLSFTRGEDGALILSWVGSPEAKTFKARLGFHFIDEKEYKFNLENKGAKTEWRPKQLRNGAYQLEVVAQAPGRADSDPAVYTFFVKPTEAELLGP